MRFITTLAIALLFVGGASAADLICVVPSASVSRASELCELLRVEVRVSTARWDNNTCATELLRRGLRNYEASTTRGVARSAVVNDVRDALVTFDANHGRIASSFCGDGTNDGAEFSEQCDDGNNEIGDGCDEFCQTE